jgi:hypothetical protein
MPFPTYGAPAGIGAKELSTPEKAVVFGPEEWQLDFTNVLIGSAAIDAANTPTTELRSGLVLGKKTSDSKLYQWDSTATDGTQKAAGVLYRGISMLDGPGIAQDKQAHVFFRGGLLVRDLTIKGAAFAGHADEHLARQQLNGCGFVLDDDLCPGSLALGAALVNMEVADAAFTPTAAQSGFRFFMTNGASTTVTLPALKAGLVYEFFRIGDEELVVASAAGSDMIVGNDLSANSVTWTTAGQHIGARLRLEGIKYGSTVKWLPSIIVIPFGTTNAGLAYAIAT